MEAFNGSYRSSRERLNEESLRQEMRLEYTPEEADTKITTINAIAALNGFMVTMDHARFSSEDYYKVFVSWPLGRKWKLITNWRITIYCTRCGLECGGHDNTFLVSTLSGSYEPVYRGKHPPVNHEAFAFYYHIGCSPFDAQYLSHVKRVPHRRGEL